MVTRTANGVRIEARHNVPAGEPHGLLDDYQDHHAYYYEPHSAGNARNAVITVTNGAGTSNVRVSQGTPNAQITVVREGQHVTFSEWNNAPALGGNVHFRIETNPPAAMNHVSVWIPPNDRWISVTPGGGFAPLRMLAIEPNNQQTPRSGEVWISIPGQQGFHRIVVRQEAALDPFFAFYGELGWEFPLRHPDSTHIASGYKLSNRPDHEGIDIQHHNPNRPDGAYNSIIGEAVFAVHSGIALAGQWSNTAGYWVAIRSEVRDTHNPINPNAPNFIVSRYLHLRYLPTVRRNDQVTQGMHIGNVGNTGFTLGTGPGGRSSGHLHLDFNNNNRYENSSLVFRYGVNPQRFFPSIEFTGSTNLITP